MKYLLLTAIAFLSYMVLPSTASAADESTEQYAVYSTVIARMFTAKDKSRQLVIKDLTSTEDTVIDKLLQESRYIARMFPTLQKGVLRDYKARNKEPLQLKESFALRIKYVLVADKEIDKLFNDKDGWWDEFYKRYPDSGGFISLSRPGFNAVMDQAFVYIEHYCGALCGTGHYVLLQKRKDRWKVVKQEMVWIS